MKQFLKILILILLPNFGIAQHESKSEKYVGFEIYLTRDFKLNDQSYTKFDEKEKQEFIEKYQNKKGLSNIPDSLCVNYINLEKIKLSENAFLNKDDIKYYDKEKYTIVLTDTGTQKMKNYQPELFGTPFIIVANGKKILPCWFRPSYSSQIVDRIYVTTNEIAGFNDKGISEFKIQSELKLGFIGCGTDLRNSFEFINELTIVKK